MFFLSQQSFSVQITKSLTWFLDLRNIVSIASDQNLSGTHTRSHKIITACRGAQPFMRNDNCVRERFVHTSFFFFLKDYHCCGTALLFHDRNVGASWWDSRFADWLVSGPFAAVMFFIMLIMYDWMDIN